MFTTTLTVPGSCCSRNACTTALAMASDTARRRSVNRSSAIPLSTMNSTTAWQREDVSASAAMDHDAVGTVLILPLAARREALQSPALFRAGPGALQRRRGTICHQRLSLRSIAEAQVLSAVLSHSWVVTPVGANGDDALGG